MAKAQKKSVGRPTKYAGKKTLNAVEVYLNTCIDEYEEWHKTRGEKSDTYERTLNIKLPTYEGLSLALNVNIDTLMEWKSVHPEFSESLGKVKKLQKEVLVAKSLSGEYNSTIAKLMLSVNHDMVERKEIDHTSKGEKIDGFNYVAPDGDSND